MDDRDNHVRLKAATVVLALLALLVGAPSARASTASLRDGTTVVYQGDASADAVAVGRSTDTRGNADPADDIPYYIVSDDGGITSGAGCAPVLNMPTMSACQVTAGLKRYEINSGGGDDTVRFDGISGTTPGDTTGGSADLGPGNDTFTGLGSGSAADTVDGGAGNDAIIGGAGNDQLIGKQGNDRLDGGAGDDSLEFAATGALSDAGEGTDDLHGGTGVDLLSYNEHTAPIRLTLDELPGDGSTGENDNVHDDIETVIATTLADSLTGDDLGQDLYGNGGNDTIDGRGGGDLLNGGTGADSIRGGAGNDTLQGSAGDDFLDGGAGQDLFEGDNPCTTLPCTGGADQIMARDDEVDSVNCGVGADRATVDLLDIVATDSQQGCESVDRAALPAATPPGGAAGIAALAPTMRLRGSRGLRALLLKGILVEVKCPAACRIRGQLILGKKVVASARRTRIAAATTRLRIKTTKAGRRRLKHRTKVRMRLVIDVTDSAGTKTTLTKAITFKTTTKKKTTAKKPS